MGTKQPCLGDESQILGMAAGFPPLQHLITPLHPKFDSNRTFARAEKLPSKEQGSCVTTTKWLMVISSERQKSFQVLF